MDSDLEKHCWRFMEIVFPREQSTLGIDRVLSLVQCSEVIARKEEYFGHKEKLFTFKSIDGLWVIKMLYVVLEVFLYVS